MNAVPAVRLGLDDRGAATDAVLMSMLMPVPAAACGIERIRFAGRAWMTDAGGAPMRSSVAVPIAGIVSAVDGLWQTGVLNDLSACRGVGMINVVMNSVMMYVEMTVEKNGLINVVMTVAAIAVAIVKD